MSEVKVRVSIGRTTGPVTDLEIDAEFLETELEVIKDVLAIVNAVSMNREKWYITVEGRSYVPYTTNVAPAPR